MGNCLTDEGTAPKSARSESNLQEMSYSDFQNSLPAENDGQAPPPRHQRPVPAAGYPHMGYPGYGMHGPMRYADQSTAGYYHPSGPVLLLDPYTGITYECDMETYEHHVENERRYQRRKDRRKPSSHYHQDDDDKKKRDEEEGDKKKRHHHRHHHHHQSSGEGGREDKEPTENGGPDTSSVAKEMPQTPADVKDIPMTLTIVKDTPETSSAAVTSVVQTSERSSTYQPRDVMISYSRSDGQVMQKIKEKLEAEGITVWVDVSSIDAGADFLSKIGEAIIDAKLLVCILSEQAVKSRYCRDEVALAYVSNTAIFPVNVQPPDQLLPLMDTGLKLQLSNYNWTSLTNPDALEANINTLVSVMKAELADLRQLAVGAQQPLSPPAEETSQEAVTSADDVELGLGLNGNGSEGGTGMNPTTDMEQPGPKLMLLRERNRAVTSVGDDVSQLMPDKFWSDRFGVCDFVMWERFTSAFFEEFRELVERTFSSEDQQYLMDILKRELEVDTDRHIFKYQFMGFCSSDGAARPVWQCVHDQARESFAMREVFNMDSTVRVEAIENLGKFRSAAVINALQDLLTDPDANVRAVATVSLSRTDVSDPVTIRHILRMLSDKDRLVREAACLALGHLKVRQAVSQLTHLWRNDVISHVREAAAAALRQIGGQEVENAMRVTKVLAEEIRSLSEVKS